jgi:hypothetical protein
MSRRLKARCCLSAWPRPYELLKEHDWLKKHREKSVTEIEILHGVLENPKMQKYSFFYLCDPEKSRQPEE